MLPNMPDVSVYDIKSITSVLTMVGGKIVFDAGVLVRDRTGGEDR